MDKQGDTLEEGEDLITDVDDEEANRSIVTQNKTSQGLVQTCVLIVHHPLSL